MTTTNAEPHPGDIWICTKPAKHAPNMPYKVKRVTSGSVMVVALHRDHRDRVYTVGWESWRSRFKLHRPARRK